MCRLMFCIKFGKLTDIISLNFFSPFFLVSFRHSHRVHVDVINYVPYLWDSVNFFFILFLLCPSGFVICLSVLKSADFFFCQLTCTVESF